MRDHAAISSPTAAATIRAARDRFDHVPWRRDEVMWMTAAGGGGGRRRLLGVDLSRRQRGRARLAPVSPTAPRALALVATCLAIGLAAAAAPPARAGGLGLRHCMDADSRAYHRDMGGRPGLDYYDTARRARCGRLTVPLDRSGAVAGAVRLHVTVLPPRRGPVRGTIVGLTGGPGQAATARLRDWADTLGPALRTRRLVAFDQRGTGASDPLACPSLRRRPLTAAVAACAAKLGTARGSYGTAASVEDLDAVRAALDAPRVVLYGTS